MVLYGVAIQTLYHNKDSKMTLFRKVTLFSDEKRK